MGVWVGSGEEERGGKGRDGEEEERALSHYDDCSKACGAAQHGRAAWYGMGGGEYPLACRVGGKWLIRRTLCV